VVGASAAGPAPRSRGDGAAQHYLPAVGDALLDRHPGVFVRRNLITILLSIEIMLNAVNLTFRRVRRALGRRRADHRLLVIDRAAAEAAVGLAIIISLFRHREPLNPESFTALKW